MQTTGQITDINIDYKTHKSKISLLLDTNELDTIEQLKNQDKLNIELKKWYKKRSLDANAYCWVLCDMIAKEISKDGTIITKEELEKLVNKKKSKTSKLIQKIKKNKLIILSITLLMGLIIFDYFLIKSFIKLLMVL